MTVLTIRSVKIKSPYFSHTSSFARAAANKTEQTKMISSRMTTVARTALVQHQRRGFYSVTPGLPQVRVSLGEKVIHGLAIFGGVLAYPVWVLAHMREYRTGGH
ncbi:uncharacterized protein LOC134220955 [Armigeres subalbatus]|uniref:uncharacterized protein LOC134220955 n=1 Tax=Armigeres subalbatus TaxID=124917 RepID=UPI002ED5FD1F